MALFRPLELADALGYLAEAPATVLAGGTDLYPLLGDRLPPRRVLDLTAIAALKGIGRDGADWRIGGGVTWAELLAAPLPPQFDGLKQAARQVGSVQIQTAATLAGNICNASPAADGVPALLALDARVEIASAAGRRTVPLSEFITGPRRTTLGAGEVVTALLVPDLAGDIWSGFAKLGSRAYLVISIVSVAAVLRFDGARLAGARLAVGACSPVPLRLGPLESALAGQPRAVAPDQVTAGHLAALSPIDDVRATGAYRREAALALTIRLLRQGCAGGGQG